QKNPKKAPGYEAAEDANEDEHRWDARALPTDEIGFDKIVHDVNEQPGSDDKDRPTLLVLVSEPGGDRNPYEAGANLHHCEHETEQSEYGDAGNSCNNKTTNT